MSNKITKKISKEYKRLKDKIEKIVKPQSEPSMPQLVLQPYRNPKRFGRFPS
jgi:hypothetical protein